MCPKWNHIVRGPLRLVTGLDVLTVNDAGLKAHNDSASHTWPAASGPVLLTHDVNTMIDTALERIVA